MATATNVTLGPAPSGQRLRAGKFPAGNAALTGVASAAADTASGGLAVAGPAGATVGRLRLQPGATGTLPFAGTLYLVRGAVPAGQTLVSSDEPTLRASVLSTYDDGSAAVAVVSGRRAVSSGVAQTLAVQTAASASGSPLGLGTIQTIMTTAGGIALVLGGAGSAARGQWSTAHRVWWDGPECVCAQYLDAVTGQPALQLVTYVRAFADGRAHWMCVLELAQLNAASATPAAPVPVSYTGTLTVGGQVVAPSVSSAGAPEGTHAPFRAQAWEGWVGGSAPQITATQHHEDLQWHPLLFRPARSANGTLASYAADAYVPWGAGRHRASNMGGGSDHDSIAPLPRWDAIALQTGDSRAWGASRANALAVLGFAINYRDSASGRVPTFGQIGAKSWQNGSGAWPMHAYNGAMGWEVAHHPAVGLMAFAADPHPVFIELAQKVAVTNGTWGAASTPNWTSGLHGYFYQVRGRAWCLRSQAHATFLTPDGDPWKAPALTMLATNVTYLDQWRTDGRYSLAGMCDQGPTDPFDHDSGVAGMQVSMWQHMWMTAELSKIVQANVLTGSAQTAARTLAEWCASIPVRWVTEQPDGGWRFVPYRTTAGATPGTIGSLSTWGAERARAGNHNGSPAAVAGPWMTHSGTPTSYTIGAGAYYDATAEGLGSYPRMLWLGLCAARELGVFGADQAWAIVNNLITTMAAWLDVTGDDPRFGPTPRALGMGAAQGSYNAGTYTWTPGRDAAGRVNKVSRDLLPAGTWVRVAGTRMDVLDAPVKAAIPGWEDWGNETGWKASLNNWCSLVDDRFSGRLWSVANGGHNGGSNTGIYLLDALKMAWSIVRMPSDTTRWSAQYRNRTSPQPDTYSSCLESDQERAAKVTAGTWSAINDWWWDEIYWDNPGVPSGVTGGEVGIPTSVHTYHEGAYDPIANKLIRFGRGKRLWTFNLATGKWDYKRVINDGVNESSFSGAGAVVVLDERIQRLWRTTAIDGVFQAVGFDLRSATWVANILPWAIYNPAMCRVGRSVYAIDWIDDGATASNNGRYWVLDLDTQSVATTAAAPQYAGGLSKAQMARLARYQAASAGLCFVPPANRLLYVQENFDVQGRIFEIDPTTTPWTIRYETAPNTPTVHPNACRKIFWVEDLGAVVLVDEADQDIWIKRY